MTRNKNLKNIAQQGHDDGYEAGYAFSQQLMQKPVVKKMISCLLWPLSLLNRMNNNIAYLFAQELHAGNTPNKFGFFAYTHQPERNYFFGNKGPFKEYNDTFLFHQWPTAPFTTSANQAPTVQPNLPKLDQAILSNPQWQLHQYKSLTPFFLIFTASNKTYKPFLLSEAYAARSRKNKGIQLAIQDIHQHLQSSK